ncbi:hypothetical protein DSO57_1007380 [Entomophthora muscae]|uniref:Uncharacterized protein n=1 Tax=Entomophthora muscae TaxID=34485 RepID=A0ACC2TUJ9_9FUNG|nr:hypothetical protein DSO57_1007380 [Entomophthora muscae]
MIPYYFLPKIFQYLESNDQRQLCLVSTEWNEFLLPFVFARLSTDRHDGVEELMCNYSEFVREVCVNSLDARMTELLSACNNTTRLFINLKDISPEAALILGESFPNLSYLELYYADSDKLSYLSPLTRKVKTLYYYPIPCDNLEEFMTYYKDFDCPLVTHLKIEEEWTLSGDNFPYIIGKFPALKTFEYAVPSLHGFQFTHFFYDVENTVFKEIRFESRDTPMSAFLRFQDDIPLKTPLLSSDEEVTHESQFHALLDIHSFYYYIPRFTCLDAIDLKTTFLDQEDFIDLLLSLKGIRSLSFDFKYQEFSPDLCKETFKATAVFIEVFEPKLPVVLVWLASCFPNLQELGIHLLDLPDNYEKRESKLTFEFWKSLIRNCSNLSIIHLSNVSSSQCRIEKEYPRILVDNKRQLRHFDLD